jgi:hypothetical protein
VLKGIKFTFLLLLLLKRFFLNIQVLYFKIKSKVILAFIILITSNLIKKLLFKRFILLIKYLAL